MGRIIIICAEEDTISSEILNWAGARDLWDEHYEKTGYFSVVYDILSSCHSAEVIAKQYDNDAPGRSGIEYTIKTDNPEQLKKEVMAAVVNIIKPADADRIPSQAPVLAYSAGDIARILMGLAAAARRTRLPAGYQGMAESNYRNLTAAAESVLAASCDKSTIRDILAALNKKIYGEAIRSDINKVIEKL